MTMESAEEAQAVVDKFDSHVSCFGISFICIFCLVLFYVDICNQF